MAEADGLVVGWVDVGLVGWWLLVGYIYMIISWWFFCEFWCIPHQVSCWDVHLFVGLCGHVRACGRSLQARSLRRGKENRRKWECFWMVKWVKYIKIGATEQRLNGSYFSSHKSLHFLFLFARLWGKRRKLELKPNLGDGVCFWCNTCSFVSSLTSSLSWTQLDPASLVTSSFSF